MKSCYLIEDLLPMYAEGLCSSKTTAELEAHLQECSECSKKLELYRAKLEQKISDEKAENSTVNVTEAEPMKKMCKKLRHGRIKVTVMSALLVALLGAAVYGLHGDITHKHLGALGCYSYLKCRHIMSEYCKGNLEPFVDAMCVSDDALTRLYSSETVHENGSFSEKTYSNYRAYMRKELELIRADFAGDQQLKYELDVCSVANGEGIVSDTAGLPQLTFNAYVYREGEKNITDSEYGTEMVFHLESTGKYSVENVLMGVEKALAQPQYPLSDLNVIENTLIKSFYYKLKNGEVTMSTEEELRLMMTAPESNVDTTNKSVKLFNQLWLVNHLSASEDAANKLAYQMNFQKILQDGWYLKDCEQFVDQYDETKHIWISMKDYLFENQQSGELCIVRIPFYGSLDKLVPNADYEIIGGVGIAEETRNCMMQLFQQR